MTKQLWTGTKPISGKEAEILGKTMKKALLNPKPLIRKNPDYEVKKQADSPIP